MAKFLEVSLDEDLVQRIAKAAGFDSMKEAYQKTAPMSSRLLRKGNQLDQSLQTVKLKRDREKLLSKYVLLCYVPIMYGGGVQEHFDRQVHRTSEFCSPNKILLVQEFLDKTRELIFFVYQPCMYLWVPFSNQIVGGEVWLLLYR